MHIEMLKIFCDLADLRSFSKTAEKHLLSQSAVSQQLAQMELAHKCQLINRRKRPIELTNAGQLLYQASKDMLDRYEQLKNELRTLQKSSVSACTRCLTISRNLWSATRMSMFMSSTSVPRESMSWFYLAMSILALLPFRKETKDSMSMILKMNH